MNTSSRHRSGLKPAGGRTVTSRSRGLTAPRSATAATVGGLASQPELRNERARIVGDRTGILADLQVSAVRAGRFLARGVRVAARQVADVVTPVGWGMLAAAAVAFALGYGLSLPESAGLGWGLAVIIVVAGFFLVGGSAHELRLVMAHDRVVVGERAVGSVVVRNPRRRRVLGAAIEVPVGAGLLELPLPSLSAGGSHEEVFTVPTSQRGVIRIGPVRTVRADPIGLVRREHVWSASVELFVHPRTVSIASASTGFLRDLEGQVTRDITSSDIAFHALRDYRPGDERRFIHWKSTAKQGSYMVKQFEETRRSRLLVALSLASDDYESPEQFELAVSAAGSLGVRAIRDGRSVSVVVSERTPEFAKRAVVASRALRTLTTTRLLDDLAGIETEQAALGIVDLARVAAEDVSGISVAYLVLGSVPSVARLRSAAAAFPPGVEVIAVVCDAGFAPGLTRVGELTVLTVGFLDDLQKSLARARSL